MHACFEIAGLIELYTYRVQGACVLEFGVVSNYAVGVRQHLAEEWVAACHDHDFRPMSVSRLLNTV